MIFPYFLGRGIFGNFKKVGAFLVILQKVRGIFGIIPNEKCQGDLKKDHFYF